MKQIIINAYEYHELKPNAQYNVIVWLDTDPLEYWHDDSEESTAEYFSNMSTEDIQEHCEANGYLFDDEGRPVHHLGAVIA